MEMAQFTKPWIKLFISDVTYFPINRISFGDYINSKSCALASSSVSLFDFTQSIKWLSGILI